MAYCYLFTCEKDIKKENQNLKKFKPLQVKKIKKYIGIGLLGVLLIVFTSFKSDFFEIAKQLEIYAEVFKQLDMYYIDEINPAELNEKAMKSMLGNLDPYTVFYDEQGIEDVRIKRSGEYAGIGAHTRYRDKRLFILEPYKESPAAKAGLKAGDEILQIDNILLKDHEEGSVGNLLRGTPGTTVNLRVLRQGKELDIKVERSKIDINPVPYYDMIDAETGYISFVKFNKKASIEIKKAIGDLKERGMKKLVFDLRNNPGGLLNQAVKITNMFIPKDKTVVTTKSKVKKWSNTYKTKNEPIEPDLPMVVLINGRSASASEIVSGSLQDYDRAVIMGERSFGKGLVQRYRKLAYGTQMKLTIAKYYTPSGRCIQELDYSNRNEEGDVPKFSDGKVNTFRTSNGRKVYDGGGVMPDVEIDKPKTLDLTKQLFASDAFFNFITDYYYAHPQIASPDQFQIDEIVFDELMQYLKNHNKDFETKLESSFEKALKKSDKDSFDNSLHQDYEIFENKIIEHKINKLTENKIEILYEINEEILKRYYYSEGAYKNKLHFDPVIVQAAALLQKESKYERILK